MRLWRVEWDELCPYGVWMRRISDPLEEVEAERVYYSACFDPGVHTRNVVVRECQPQQ